MAVNVIDGSLIVYRICINQILGYLMIILEFPLKWNSKVGWLSIFDGVYFFSPHK